MEKDLQLAKAYKIIEQELVFSSSVDTKELWLSALKFRINELIQHDFPKLIFILYRLDVDESRLTKLLTNFPGSDAGTIISELIIERQLQKIKTREAFMQDDANINEDEKW